jgi:hypothetical protein
MADFRPRSRTFESDSERPAAVPKARASGALRGHWAYQRRRRATSEGEGSGLEVRQRVYDVNEDFLGGPIARLLPCCDFDLDLRIGLEEVRWDLG